MRYGSVCSGIEAATAAWHHMGWEPAFFSEIEAFPRAVLEHHYPEVPLHGDFTTIEQNQYGKIDLLVGGTPCQSFSVAGLRGGLDDDRGNLALEFCRLAQREQPRWIVWENVPGVLSSSGGRDFGSILGALEDLGYGLAYRVLDAQYFGVAQRRRRVFVVGYLGDWRPAAAVLFERHSMSGHPAPSREARKEAARAASVSTHECGGIGSYNESDVSSPLLRSGADKGHGCEAIIAGGDGPSVSWPADVACTLDTDFATKWGQNNQHVNAGCPLFVPDNVGTLRTRRPGEGGVQGDFDHIVPVVSPALNTQSGSHHAPDTKAYVVVHGTQDPCVSTDTAFALGRNNGGENAIAYSIMPMNSGKDYKARETEVAQPIMAAGPVGGNQGGDFVVQAFAQNTRDEVRIIGGDGEIAGALAAQPGMKQTTYLAIGFNGDQSEKTRSMGEREEQAPTLRAGSTSHVAIGFDAYNNDVTGDVSKTIDTGQDYHHVPNVFSFSAKDHGGDATEELSPTLRAGGFANSHQNGGVMPAVAYDHPGRFNNIHGGSGEHHSVLPTLEATNPKQIVAASAVRRLTPVECERLQGFPDNFTAIPWKKKGPEQCPDGPRYKALGNSMAVPVMRWIGERIQLVDDLISVL